MRVCPRCRSIYSMQMDFCGIDGERIIEQDDDPLVGRTIERYRILERVARGAMGCVYRATHSVLRYDYAIKVLFGDIGCNKTFVERLRREAEAVSMIRHPYVVSVVDFGTTRDGLTFLVMEYVQGRPLDTVIKSDAPFPVERAARVARQIASGLSEAHRLGFVHRDVKPANIMLTEEVPGIESVKILDFGVVGLNQDPAETRLTGSGHLIGTPTYMAPEQGHDASVTFSADLYSLGVILFEMLVGEPPFPGATSTEILVKHITEPVPAIAPSRGLEQLAYRLLEKSPSKRFASADDVVREIDRLVAAAAEPPPIERTPTPRLKGFVLTGDEIEPSASTDRHQAVADADTDDTEENGDGEDTPLVVPVSSEVLRATDPIVPVFEDDGKAEKDPRATLVVRTRKRPLSAIRAEELSKGAGVMEADTVKPEALVPDAITQPNASVPISELSDEAEDLPEVDAASVVSIPDTPAAPPTREPPQPALAATRDDPEAPTIQEAPPEALELAAVIKAATDSIAQGRDVPIAFGPPATPGSKGEEARAARLQLTPAPSLMPANGAKERKTEPQIAEAIRDALLDTAEGDPAPRPKGQYEYIPIRKGAGSTRRPPTGEMSRPVSNPSAQPGAASATEVKVPPLGSTKRAGPWMWLAAAALCVLVAAPIFLMVSEKEEPAQIRPSPDPSPSPERSLVASSAGDPTRAATGAESKGGPAREVEVRPAASDRAGESAVASPGPSREEAKENGDGPRAKQEAPKDEAVGQRTSEASEDRGSARSRKPPKAAPPETRDSASGASADPRSSAPSASSSRKPPKASPLEAAKLAPDPKDQLTPVRPLEEVERTLASVAKERGLATADLPWLSPEAASATKRWQTNRSKDRDAARAAVTELLDIVEHAHAGPRLLQLKLNRVSVGLSRAGGILAGPRFTDLKSRFAELNGAVGTGLPQDEYDRLAVQIDDLEHDLGVEIASAQQAAKASSAASREAPSP